MKNRKKLMSYMPGGKLDAYQMAGIVPPNTEEWYRQHPETANYTPLEGSDNAPQYSRQFNFFQPNAAGLGLMGAYLGSKVLLNKSNERNYQAYKDRWIRNYNIPSFLQDPNKFSSVQYEAQMARRGGIMQTGGITKGSANYGTSTGYQQGGTLPRLNPNEMAYFNRFNQYVRDQGYDKSPKLNDQNLSRKLYSDFQATDDSVQIPYEEFIPRVQQEQYNLRNFTQGLMQRKNVAGADSIMNNITPFDGLYGPRTNSYDFPNVIQQTYRNENLVQQRDLGLTSGQLPNKKDGGLSRGEDYGSKKKPYPSVKSSDFAGGGRSYPIPTKADAIDALRLAGLHGRDDVRAKVYRKYPELKKQMGGLTMNTPEDQARGYYGYPNASSLTFPGSGKRTFVPGPFPLLVQDQNGTQLMTNKPVNTMGNVREIPMFEKGGEVRKHAIKVDREDATIEAEKGELILGAGAPGAIEDQEKRVGLGLYKIGGKLHSQGGTPLLAHEGDFVFSNDKSLAVTEEESKLLVGKEIKKLKLRTPAKLAERYLDLNKFIDMAQDGEIDPISKKTAMLNINNYIDRLAEIALKQEEQKGFPEGTPAFVDASVGVRFDEAALQSEINAFRYGGSVLPKHQTKGIVTDDIRRRARLVDKVPAGFQPFGAFGDKQYYQNDQGQLVEAPQAVPGGTPGKPWENKMIELLQSGVSIDELVKRGHGTKPGLTQKFGQYEQPARGEDFVYTGIPGEPTTWSYPSMNRGPLPVGYNRPAVNLPGAPVTDTGTGDPLDQFLQGSNSQFDLNTAEAYNILASSLPSESRYPPAFRNYEIQNAKAQIASTGRPISEQIYLNAIRRSNLGFDQNNTAQGSPGATRNLAAYTASLQAENQAISQVYNQNIARGDQKAQALAQLEVQDGLDRITNAEKYDVKLETLANNKELEARNRRQNIGLQLNQMQRDRESKALFNVMSDQYQINRNNTIGLKPTYRIQDGKLVPYQRNYADLVRNAGTTTNTQYLDRARQIFDLMSQYGIKSGAFVDELVKEAANPRSTK